MARRVLDGIRLLRLELVETEPALETHSTNRPSRDDQISVDPARAIQQWTNSADEERSVVLQWLLEIILADGTSWSAEELYEHLLTEGKFVTWH